MDSPAPKLRATAEGWLQSDNVPQWPFMTPALEGELTEAGELSLGRWGAGEIGRLRIVGLAGPFAVAPNRLSGANGAAVIASPSAPALLLRGVRPDEIRQNSGGRLVVEPRGDDWLVAGGVDADEAARGLAAEPARILAEADAYARRCDQLPAAEPLLRSLVIQGAHAALSSVRAYPDGAFAGLAAGLAYATPARTYFRDGYWTLPILQRLAPATVVAEIELLASRVLGDGEAPSGVILAGAHADRFEQRRLEELALAATHWRRGEWWSDHFDSPLFLVLAVGDQVAASGDDALARRLWPQLTAVFERYLTLRGPDGLPMKPRNDRDWADEVFRSGLVSYDLGLWVGALDVLARLGETIAPNLAVAAREEAGRARAAIDRKLWRGDAYVDYQRLDGTAEDHLALDALMLLRFGAAPEPRAEAMLGAIAARLESRRNTVQPYGDFGMLCAWPPFARPDDLRAKSAFPYRYHNGGEWPWLDAVYAAERLRRGLGGWRYPLTRWWEWCLAQGWAGPVEHFSVPFGRGSLLQAWSSLPAAVALQFAEVVLAGDPEADPDPA
ncbi:MAG TPA: GH116 family glycosyl hydrolase [Caulobacteraceae bacterium]|nr:GH116 family glycosyl hydrolase [Caulobacteraceae bacterium]